jgi:DnaD/phage-associated family protein
MPTTPTFEGFPKGESETVLIPARFFSDLLPQIDDLAELKVTLYCLWAVQQREGTYRYLRLREMAADALFMAGLGADAETALRDGLARAVRRGTLLAALVPTAAGDEEVYFLNTERGRRAIEALERGDWQPGRDGALIGLIADRPNIFALYEQNIGPITPMLAETLRDAERTYPPEWVADALRLAVENNKRSWRYAEAILKRWALEGRSADSTPRAEAAEEESRYLRDAYFQRRAGREGEEK